MTEVRINKSGFVAEFKLRDGSMRELDVEMFSPEGVALVWDPTQTRLGHLVPATSVEGFHQLWQCSTFHAVIPAQYGWFAKRESADGESMIVGIEAWQVLASGELLPITQEPRDDDDCLYYRDPDKSTVVTIFHQAPQGKHRQSQASNLGLRSSRQSAIDG